jgi:putative FmdB family regulatory protein
MPTYEYRCRACNHELEAVQAFSDDPLTECPECGGSLRKLFGSIGVTFKGSGFYKNDHGSRAKSGATAGSTEGSSGSSESSAAPAAAPSTSPAASSSSSSSSSD